MRKQYLSSFLSFRRTPVAIVQSQFERLDRVSIRGNIVIFIFTPKRKYLQKKILHKQIAARY